MAQNWNPRHLVNYSKIMFYSDDPVQTTCVAPRILSASNSCAFHSHNLSKSIFAQNSKNNLLHHEF